MRLVIYRIALSSQYLITLKKTHGLVLNLKQQRKQRLCCNAMLLVVIRGINEIKNESHVKKIYGQQINKHTHTEHSISKVPATRVVQHYTSC